MNLDTFHASCLSAFDSMYSSTTASIAIDDKYVVVLFHVLEHIPSKLLTYKSNCNIETLLIKLILKRESYFFMGPIILIKLKLRTISNV